MAGAGSADTLPTPDAGNRTGRMLLAGGITCTVTIPDGQHVTLRINSRRRTGRGGWANCSPADDGARTSIYAGGNRTARIGRIMPGWQLQMFGASGHVRDAVRQLFAVASGADVTLIGGRLALANGYRLQVADRCGRCGRELTDPVSIDRGTGPECAGHSTGSQHAPVHGAADAPLAGILNTRRGPHDANGSLAHLGFRPDPPAAAPADQSITDVMGDLIEDEIDAYMADHPPADDAPADDGDELALASGNNGPAPAADDAPADDAPAADWIATHLIDNAPADPAPAAPAPTIAADVAAQLAAVEIAAARRTIAAAFRSRSPRQLQALAIFDQLAARPVR
jgi:hypothetical protein